MGWGKELYWREMVRCTLCKETALQSDNVARTAEVVAAGIRKRARASGEAESSRSAKGKAMKRRMCKANSEIERVVGSWARMAVR